MNLMFSRAHQPIFLDIEIKIKRLLNCHANFFYLHHYQSNFGACCQFRYLIFCRKLLKHSLFINYAKSMLIGTHEKIVKMVVNPSKGQQAMKVVLAGLSSIELQILMRESFVYI